MTEQTVAPEGIFPVKFHTQEELDSYTQHIILQTMLSGAGPLLKVAAECEARNGKACESCNTAGMIGVDMQRRVALLMKAWGHEIPKELEDRLMAVGYFADPSTPIKH